MESYRHAHHAHGRTSHLTQLYSDTKKSALFSIHSQDSTATQQVPALNRKFRIQKDRLMTWGLAWSDDGKGADGNIDDAVAKADLTETCESVLNNIKEVSEEAAKLQQAAQSPGILGLDSKIGEKARATTFDEVRYQDLLDQLTTAIDILYDLSHSRRAIARGEHPSFNSVPHEKSFMNEKPGCDEKSFATGKSFGAETPISFRKSSPGAPSFAASEATLVNPSFQRPSLSPYAGLPPRIDESALRLSVEGPPPYESLGVPSTTRLVAQLIRSKVSESVQHSLGSSAAEVPVLVEYANFDAIFRDTHVPPPLQRVEALASYLQPMRPESQHNLSLIGYFEDSAQPRIGLVYDVPYSIQNQLRGTFESAAGTLAPVSLLKLVQKSTKTQTPNGESAVPALEHRFSLALRLVEQLHSLHTQEVYHGNINSSSVIFATMAGESSLRPTQMRSPLWASFDLFSKCSYEGVKRNFNLNIYRHPSDLPQALDRSAADDVRFDLYGLALVLLEVGLWTPIGDLYKAKYTLQDFKLRLEKLWIPRLASKCGSVYMKVVRECFRLADDPSMPLRATGNLYSYLLERLRLCCLLDEDESATDAFPTSESVAASAASPYNSKDEQKRPQFTQERGCIGRQFSDPTDLLRSDSISTGISASSYRLSSLADLAAASVPNANIPPTNTPPLPRQPSVRSQTSLPGSISRGRGRLSRQMTSSPSFHDYQEKVALIQRKWREVCARRAGSRLMARSIDQHQKWEASAHSIHHEDTSEQQSRSRRQEFRHLAIPQKCIEDWTCKYSYQLAKLGERALRGLPESSDIRLTMYGESEETARPTFLFSCEKSTAKVKQVLKRHFRYDPSIYDLRVKKSDSIRRCRRSKRYGDSAAYRSMAPSSGVLDKAANPDYQERPLCGASIGAFRDEEHLPPVSFGGVVLVDGKAYGMSVHHMLEPDDEDDEDNAVAGTAEDVDSDTSSIRSSDNISIYNHSDDESTVRPSSAAFPDPEEDDDVHEGDVSGITPDDYEEIAVTQPALDDAIDCDLHVDVDDEDDDEEDSGIDEDHLLSYKLGQVHASSGLKRSVASTQDGFKSISQSLPQEIDWALFELVPPRAQAYNIVKGASKYCAVARSCGNVYPVAVRQSTELSCAKVHCVGRTSGLASGVISSTMELVKIHGRSTFSASWTVDGDFGVGGDSGAWVISNDDGRVCGHVLAAKKGRTFICPMDLLLNDIKQTLGAGTVSLPSAASKISKTAVKVEVEEMVSMMRIDDQESGGVKLPVSPAMRAKSKGGFTIARRPVGMAG